MPIYHNMYLVVGWPAAKVEPTHVVVLRLFSLPTSLQQLSFACEREKDSFMQFRYSLQFLRTDKAAAADAAGDAADNGTSKDGEDAADAAAAAAPAKESVKGTKRPAEVSISRIS